MGQLQHPKQYDETTVQVSKQADVLHVRVNSRHPVTCRLASPLPISHVALLLQYYCR